MRGKENLVWRYEGYVMRPARLEDAESYYEQNYRPLDKEIIRMTGSKESYTKEEVVSFFRKAVEDPQYFCFLLLTKTGRLLGRV